MGGVPMSLESVAAQRCQALEQLSNSLSLDMQRHAFIGDERGSGTRLARIAIDRKT